MVSINEIHKAIYNNVYVLSISCGNPKLLAGIPLQDHLKPDMFNQVNYDVYEQVIYFLLRTIDNDLCKKRITWPIYGDKKLRAEFRNDLKNIVKVLNEAYPTSRIPNLQTSYLLTPGKYQIKILDFLFYLSELAMYEYLKREIGDDDLLLPPSLGENHELNLKRLEDFELLVRYEKKVYADGFNSRQEEINNLLFNGEKVVETINNLQSRLDNTQKNVDQTEHETHLDRLSNKLEEINKFEKCIDKTTYLLNLLKNPDQTILNFELKSLTLPKSLFKYHNILESEKLSLMPFLDLISTILNNYAKYISSLPAVDTEEIEDLHQQITDQYLIAEEKMKAANPWLEDITSNAQRKMLNLHKILPKRYENCAIGTHLSQTSKVSFDVSSPCKQISENSSMGGRSLISKFSTTSKKKRSGFVKEHRVLEKVKKNLLMSSPKVFAKPSPVEKDL